jgi:hypothetical protein
MHEALRSPIGRRCGSIALAVGLPAGSQNACSAAGDDDLEQTGMVNSDDRFEATSSAARLARPTSER